MESNNIPSTSISQFYNIIAQARKLHIINQRRKIGENTRLNYKKIAERLIFRDKQLPLSYAKNKSTYYVYKAAIASYVLDEISKTMPTLDTIKKSNLAGWEAEVAHLKQYIEFLLEIGIDQEKQNLNEYKNGNFCSEWTRHGKSDNHGTKKSKARRLKTLPINWTQRLFEHALKSHSKHTIPIAVMAISGCRPQEFSYGVELRLNADQSIHVHIKGAKTHEGLYGQAFRAFDVSNESAELIYLRELLQSHVGRLIVTANPGAVCDKVSYLSRKVMPGLKEPATAYCYRHRFSASLHHAGLDSESIAKALGHCTDQSQQHYSTAYRSGAAGFTIRNIVSAQPINNKNAIRAAIKQSGQSLH